MFSQTHTSFMPGNISPGVETLIWLKDSLQTGLEPLTWFRFIQFLSVLALCVKCIIFTDAERLLPLKNKYRSALCLMPGRGWLVRLEKKSLFIHLGKNSLISSVLIDKLQPSGRSNFSQLFVRGSVCSVLKTPREWWLKCWTGGFF